MKKMVAAILAAILLGSMIGSAVAETGFIASIVGINEEKGYIVADDGNYLGYEWRIKGTDGFHLGQVVVVITDENFEAIAVYPLSYAPPYHELYGSLFKITEIDRNEHLVSLVDCNGFEFLIDDEDDWQVGDFVTAVLDNNATDTITDDEIIAVNYERPDLLRAW